MLPAGSAPPGTHTADLRTFFEDSRLMHRLHLTVSDHPVSDKVGIPTPISSEGHG